MKYLGKICWITYTQSIQAWNWLWHFMYSHYLKFTSVVIIVLIQLWLKTATSKIGCSCMQIIQWLFSQFTLMILSGSHGFGVVVFSTCCWAGAGWQSLPGSLGERDLHAGETGWRLQVPHHDGHLLRCLDREMRTVLHCDVMTAVVGAQCRCHRLQVTHQTRSWKPAERRHGHNTE